MTVIIRDKFYGFEFAFGVCECTLNALLYRAKLEAKVEISVDVRRFSLIFSPLLSLLGKCEQALRRYRSGTLNSNTVNSKFHLIRGFFEIFARFLSFHV